MLSLEANGPKMDLNMLFNTLEVSRFAEGSFTNHNNRMPRALGRAEKHYWEAKTRENHEKTCIAGINIETHSNR